MIYIATVSQHIVFPRDMRRYKALLYSSHTSPEIIKFGNSGYSIPHGRLMIYQCSAALYFVCLKSRGSVNGCIIVEAENKTPAIINVVRLFANLGFRIKSRMRNASTHILPR